MSDDQEERSEPKPRVRKIVRSAATAERPVFEAPPEGADKPAGEGAPAIPAVEGEAPASGRKWDVRAERSAVPARPRPPRGPRPGAPRPTSPDGSYAAPAGAEPDAAAAAPEGQPERPRRRFNQPDLAMPRRPGTPFGRVTPELRRGPADRSSPDFVDKWLSMPPRKPEDRPPGRGPRDGRGPREDGKGPNDRRPERGAERGDRKDKRPMQARPAQRIAPPAPVSQPKMPTLHETIMVGLPKVEAPGQRDKSANKPKTAKEALAAKTAHSQKPKAQEAERGGEELIETAWLTATADTASDALRSAGNAADALVDAWIKANNLAAVAQAAHDESLTGAARKAAKRAVNVLRSRGVSLPEPKPVAAQTRSAEEEVVEATFTPPDGRGTMSFTIAKRRGGDRAHIAEIIVREGVGIVNAVSGWMSRSQIKEAHQRVADASGSAPVTVPAEWARWRVEVALKENAKSGQLVPLGLERCKELLEPKPASEPKHPAHELEVTITEDATSAASDLHAEPELRGWMPEARAIDELVQKVGAKLSAEDAKDAEKVDVVLKEEVKLATDRYFTPEQRALLAQRMRDIAVAVRQRAGDDRAKDVLRAAKAIESAGLITSPPSDLEFLRFFFQKGIAFRAQAGGGSLRVPVNAG